NGTAAQRASGDFQTRIIDDQFRERQLGSGGGTERRQHILGYLIDQLGRKAGGQGSNQHTTLPIHGETARGKLQQGAGSFGKKRQEAHNSKTFFIISPTCWAVMELRQPTQNSVSPWRARAIWRWGPSPTSCSSGPACKRSPSARNRSRLCCAQAVI